jgi:hypothetical protein
LIAISRSGSLIADLHRLGASDDVMYGVSILTLA